ncbi:MAG: CHAT domain-containing protein, partial [Gemmatimonadota bacterium]
VPERAIADMIGNLLLDKAVDDEDRLRLVFLESCETAKRSSNDAFGGLGPSLVKAGVAAVVAMQDLVEVQTARPFAATFYRQLLRHGQVDLACNEARDAVITQKLRGADVPVLFMRLRSGELFKVKGRVSSATAPTFWKRVIKRLEDNTCVPFLGPRVNNGILPGPETMARQLAEENGYKLVDAGNLARVAQFEAYKDPEAFRTMYLDLLKQSVYRSLGREPTKAEMKEFAKATLTEITQKLDWGTASKGVQECGIYHLLADLQLPLYVTTNVDGFMYEALTHHPKLKPEDVRRIGPRWQKTTGGAPPHSVLSPEPNNTTPYVFHLNGFDDGSDPSQLEQIVLSEDDLMTKFVRLVRDQVEILPSNVVTRLAESSWVFLGYSLDDWEFRVVLQGLLQPIAQSNPQAKLHVGVQLEVGATASGADEADVQAYLQDYLGRRFNINVYWGSASQFVAELHQRFTAG